jgi:hypothetical protein
MGSMEAWKRKTGTIPAFALGPRKTKKNLCRDGDEYCVKLCVSELGLLGKGDCAATHPGDRSTRRAIIKKL